MAKKKLTSDDWLKRYYPIPADQVAKEDAIAHSLRKWEGLKPSVLKRYGLEVGGKNVYRKGGCEHVLVVSDGTCALCVHYPSRARWYESCNSKTCPLAKMLGWGCDANKAPFVAFGSSGNPWPMINALRKLAKDKP